LIFLSLNLQTKLFPILNPLMTGFKNLQPPYFLPNASGQHRQQPESRGTRNFASPSFESRNFVRIDHISDLDELPNASGQHRQQPESRGTRRGEIRHISHKTPEQYALLPYTDHYLPGYGIRLFKALNLTNQYTVHQNFKGIVSPKS
jgi:hypothetical protein